MAYSVSADPRPHPLDSPAVEARELVKEYAAPSGAVLAVDGISFAVGRGEIFGLLGPNGAGKSTTVLMLATLLTPTAGTARVAGHDLLGDPAGVRRAIGVALQETGLDEVQTGRQLMELVGRLHGLPREAAAGRTDELLGLVGLVDAADRRVKDYSGGMRRRIDLALALVHRPGLLFLDEPTTGLDPGSRKAIWEEVGKLNDEGTTVFLTTQYLEEADRVCDRVAIVDAGSIVAEGSPGELKRSVGGETLDDVFIELTGRHLAGSGAGADRIDDGVIE